MKFELHYPGANQSGNMRKSVLSFCLLLGYGLRVAAQSESVPAGRIPRFRVLAIESRARDHIRMMTSARPFLEKMAAENNFDITISDDTSLVNDKNLEGYQVFIPLQEAPFDMSVAQQEALERFVKQGKGWVGIHAAGLTGKQFRGANSTYWQWFEDFMGGVVYSPHPAFQKGTVIVEDHTHPATRNLPDRFEVSDEWYEFDKSPRPNVRVLASADESTYKQNKPMGDHPIMWTNEKYRRMIYIGIGHDSSLFVNPSYKILIHDAIFWAATPPVIIYSNQVGLDSRGAKIAVAGTDELLAKNTPFEVIDLGSGETAFTGTLSGPEQIEQWAPGKFFYKADYSALRKTGKYKLVIRTAGDVSKMTSGSNGPAGKATTTFTAYSSEEFEILDNALARLTIPSILHYYRKQRANTPAEWAADEKLILFGSDKTVDMRGGWCDASGDVSKYFSHLAYANYVSPQQTPMVTWSLVSATEALPGLLTELGVRDSIVDESLWGADYMMRALAPEDYFRMIVFSYFNKDPRARRVVGLLANSVTTSDYQCAFREGGGMAIAALARISRLEEGWRLYFPKQYLEGAERAFAHLLVNNTRYDDDGKENVIDDYCALMAATELWIATDSSLYRDEARKRAHNLEGRLTPEGYFRANDAGRPFWHAADAGLPVVALARYLKKES
jgi:type 1 glutamine amidotransferase